MCELTWYRRTIYLLNSSSNASKPTTLKVLVRFLSTKHPGYSPVSFPFGPQFVQVLPLTHPAGFWAIIKGWLDPVVASKIHFTSNFQELEKFIAKEAIPRGLGGSDDYEYEYIEPKQGENDHMNDAAKTAALKAERLKIIDEFQKATLDWINTASTAADKGEDIKKQRQDIATRLSDFYWKMDPYIRARSIYDRIRDSEEAAAAAAAPVAKAQEAPVKEQEQAPVSEKATTGALKPQSQVVETPVVATATAN